MFRCNNCDILVDIVTLNSLVATSVQCIRNTHRGCYHALHSIIIVPPVRSREHGCQGELLSMPVESVVEPDRAVLGCRVLFPARDRPAPCSDSSSRLLSMQFPNPRMRQLLPTNFPGRRAERQSAAEGVQYWVVEINWNILYRYNRSKMGF